MDNHLFESQYLGSEWAQLIKNWVPVVKCRCENQSNTVSIVSPNNSKEYSTYFKGIIQTGRCNPG